MGGPRGKCVPGGIPSHMGTYIMKDLGKITLLLVLYTLQGVPMGLNGSIPFLLLSKVSYKQLSALSLSSLPFSLKLLWAPVVDGFYLPVLGRRRSWLIPLQLLAGLLMIWSTSSPRRLMHWLGDERVGSDPNVLALTLFFSLLYFLMATQDIAVDGWALTLLSPENRGYASTCNTVGQTLGYCFAYVGFLALNDPEFCNRFLRREQILDKGIVDLNTFIAFWGWIFVVVTLVLFFYDETNDATKWDSATIGHNTGLPHSECVCLAGPIGGGEELHLFSDFVLPDPPDGAKNGTTGLEKLKSDTLAAVSNPEMLCEPNSVTNSYRLLWKLVFVPPVQELLLLLLTNRIAFATVDASTQIKIVEGGVKKEELAYFAPLLMPFGIVCPVLVGRWITGTAPLRPFMYGYMLRLGVCIFWAGAVVLTPILYSGNYSTAFYIGLFIITSVYNICSDLMFVSQMAFFARISDPLIGGTYMTFLNTVCNLGAQWPRALSLWLMDSFTIRRCVGNERGIQTSSGTCPVWIDGYFTQLAFCLAFGLCWAALCWGRLKRLQELSVSSWHVRLTLKTTDNEPRLSKLNRRGRNKSD